MNQEFNENLYFLYSNFSELLTSNHICEVDDSNKQAEGYFSAYIKKNEDHKPVDPINTVPCITEAKLVKILNPLDYEHLLPFDNLNSLKNNINRIIPLLNTLLKNYHSEEKNFDRIVIYFLLGVAEAISSLGETPVAAALVDTEKSIRHIDFNQREINQDPLGHAEFKTVENYCKEHRTWRLDNFSLYVNLEPCIMCCGIIRQTRISNVIFACCDLKQGCVISRAKLLDIDLLGKKCVHRITDRDICDLAETQIKDFFKKIRLRNKKIGSKSIRKKIIIQNKKELL